MAPVGRLTRSADFERVLSRRSRVQGAHFALHHLIDVPQPWRWPGTKAGAGELSTIRPSNRAQPVDDSVVAIASTPSPTPFPEALWLGAVVPKRHARRAVTRSMMKRQIRAAVLACRQHLPAGIWIVRLRAGFDRTVFPSATSIALRVVVRQELDELLSRCRAAPVGAAGLAGLAGSSGGAR